MDKVTDIRRAREARDSREADHRCPDMVLEVWVDSKGEVCASCLKGTSRVPTDTGDQKLDAAYLALAAARQGAVILSEMEEGDAWMAEPIMHVALMRGGFYCTRPNAFWRGESRTPLRQRLRCAWWVLRQLWGINSAMLANVRDLVARPGRLKDLEVE